MRLFFLFSSSLLLFFSAACAAPTDDDASSGDSAQVADAQDATVTISGDPTSGHVVATAGYRRFAIVGARVGELESGRQYVVSTGKSTSPRLENLEARELIDFRKVLHLAGTLEKDANDPHAMWLTSVHGKRYQLFGGTVDTYQSIAAALPQHDYARTLFTVDAAQDRRQPTRWTFLRYTPAPSFSCIQSDKSQVHLDLISVQPDDSLFDGFVTTDTGGEPLPGPRATCTKDKTCTFDSVGTPWGTAAFAPAASFTLAVDRTDGTKVEFGCKAVDRSTYQSED